jgi:hypothetical protein
LQTLHDSGISAKCLLGINFSMWVPDAWSAGTAEPILMIRGTYYCNLGCCGIAMLKGMIRFLCGWSLAALTRGMLVSSSPAQSLPLGNPHLRNNVDNTLAVLVAAAAPPLHSIMPSAIITQVLILNRGYHALSSCCFCRLLPQHPALLARSAATFHKKAGYSPMRWTSARHYEDRSDAPNLRGSIVVRSKPPQGQGLGLRQELEHGPCRVSVSISLDMAPD